MSTQDQKIRFKITQQGLLWGLIAIYTLLIPDAIFVYRFIESKYGSVFVGKIPLFVVVLLGIAYIIYLRISKTSLRNLVFVVPCAVIVIIVFMVEDNPNKRIHIPEYVVLAWLVYAALSRNYEGKGIYILIFICTSMLGVVDELEQGIHPGRFYGLSDMMVNCASAVIGVFTILGLTRRKTGTWEWMRYLTQFNGLCWLILYGLTSVILMCINLFAVQAAGGMFTGVYPGWLLVMNMLFLAITPVLVISYRKKARIISQYLKNNNNSIVFPELETAQLWVFPPLVILFYMHLLLLYISLSGTIFK